MPHGFRQSRRHTLLGALAAPTLGTAAPRRTRSVRIVVGFPVGALQDVLAQLLAPSAGRALGAAHSVEHRQGESGRIAIEYVRTATADGHSLLLCTPGLLALGPLVHRDLPYDPAVVLAPVVLGCRYEFALNVRADLPVTDLRSLVDWVRRTGPRDEGMAIASHGIGTISYVMAEAFNHATGLKLVHLPYRGAVSARQALNDGHAALVFDSIGDSIGPARARQVRVVATTGPTRSHFMASAPTLRELGLTGLVASGWLGISAPADTPTAVIAALNAAFDEALSTPEVRERLREACLDPAGGTPQALERAIAEDRMHWTRVLRSIGVTPEKRAGSSA